MKNAPRIWTLVFFSCSAVAISAWATSANAQSFDCNASSTLVENAICSDRDLAERDSAVAFLYRAALASGDPARVRADQRAWLVRRNACVMKPCVLEQYEQRIRELRNAVPGFVYGRFSTGNDQLHLIQTSNDRVAFRLSVIEPSSTTAHTGEIEGSLNYVFGRAGFVDYRPGCRLDLAREGVDWLVIQAGNCSNFFGLNVNANGTYRPTSGPVSLVSP